MTVEWFSFIKTDSPLRQLAACANRSVFEDHKVSSLFFFPYHFSVSFFLILKSL